MATESPARRGSPLAGAALEAFFVVLGVVLALLANEWRLDVAANRRADRALDSITQELRTNREHVQASLAYHQGILQQLAELRAADGEATLATFAQGFVKPAQVLSTAWDAAQATGVVDAMDFALVLAISQVYADQEQYLVQAREVGGVVYEYLVTEGLEGMVGNWRNLGTLMNTFQYREAQFLPRYDAVLADFAARSGSPK
ncbi:MAG TPA: hypothetical protein VGC54_14090 [Planctomycetota bacterium]